MKNQVYQLRLSDKDRETFEKAVDVANKKNVKEGIKEKVTISKIMLKGGLREANRILKG